MAPQQENHGMSDPIEVDLGTLPEELPLHLAPEAIEQRLADLIRAYVHRRSAALARSVVRHCEALLLHPALRNEPDRLDGLCCLAGHWRLLAAQWGLATRP